MTESQVLRHDYVMLRVYASELEYRLSSPSPPPNDPNAEKPTFRWDWRFASESEIEVLLGISLGPTQTRPEEVRASYVGLFAIPNERPAFTLRDFVRHVAPVDLLPYITEAISSLTTRGYFGSIVLPPLDIGTLLPQADDEATGVTQASQSPAYAALLARLNEAALAPRSRHPEDVTAETTPAAGGTARR